MKLSERINYLLLGTLWSLAILLVLDFWLNTTYNFNMFSGAHWQYVATLQASKAQISSGFYISIIIAICAGIFGFYMLLRPKFRKIIFTPPVSTKQQPPQINNNTNSDLADVAPAPQPLPSQNTISTMQRPPRLHIQIPTTTIPPRQTTQKTQQKPEEQKPLYTHEIREIFERNKYKVLTPRPIAKTPISLIALGTNETLWIGACNISHEKLADAILALQSVFKETLEDIEIDINAFIINPTDNDSVDAIMDFDSLDALSAAINKTPNEPEPQEDIASGNMDAFSGYIETVLTYLGNK